MEEKCEKCNSSKWRLREYNSDAESLDGKMMLPETLDSPLEGTITYCDECVEEANRVWWEKEKNAYIYDDFGNNPDDPEFDG
jgi:hypothetical protein